MDVSNIQLHSILKLLINNTIIKLDNTKHKKFGILNTGYILKDNHNLINIVIPGYNSKIKETYVNSINVIGILALSNNKNIFFINIDYNGFNKLKSNYDIQKYLNLFFNCNNKLRGRWIEPINI
jgi:hypothetical protein